VAHGRFPRIALCNTCTILYCGCQSPLQLLFALKHTMRPRLCCDWRITNYGTVWRGARQVMKRRGNRKEFPDHRREGTNGLHRRQESPYPAPICCNSAQRSRMAETAAFGCSLYGIEQAGRARTDFWMSDVRMGDLARAFWPHHGSDPVFHERRIRISRAGQP
jgi:hypothetical protein